MPSPRADVELLLAHVLGVPRTRLVLSDDVDRSVLVRFEALLAKRASRQPLQHLLGEAPFRRMTLRVGRGVFIPRPETEIVAEAAIRELAAAPGRLAVDLCAGSGALGSHSRSRSRAAPCTSSRSTRTPANGCSATPTLAGQLASVGSVVHVHRDDATRAHESALAALVGTVDVVACNPPYIPDEAAPRDPEVREHDPPLALYGGEDGLDVVRGVALSAAALLRPGGMLVIEHADTQGERVGGLGVPALLRGTGCYGEVADRVDLAGRDRYTVARRT